MVEGHQSIAVVAGRRFEQMDHERTVPFRGGALVRSRVCDPGFRLVLGLFLVPCDASDQLPLIQVLAGFGPGGLVPLSHRGRVVSGCATARKRGDKEKSNCSLHIPNPGLRC